MWVIQHDRLFSVPDTAPLPPGSTQLSLPDTLQNHRAYKIQNGAVVKRTAKEMQAAAKKKVRAAAHRRRDPPAIRN